MQTTTGTITATGSGAAVTSKPLDNGPSHTQAVVGVSGTFTGGTVVVEGKVAGGTVWYPVAMVDRATYARGNGSATPSDSTTTSWLVDCRGFTAIRGYFSAGSGISAVVEVTSGGKDEFAVGMAQVVSAVAGLASFAAGLAVTGATGVNTFTIPDNLASALDITESTNSYLKFVTTNSGEKIIASKPIDLADAATLAAAGSAQGDAGAIVHQVSFVSAADGTTGVVLPVAAAGVLRVIYNLHASAGLKIYPASGDDINDGTTDAAVTIEGKTMGIFLALDATTWAAIYTVNT